MKKVFLTYIIVVLVLLCSCANSKSDLDGLWESAYQIQTEPNRGIADYKKFMRIDGDSLFFKTTGEPKLDFAPINIKSKFHRTSNGIETEDENFHKIYIHEISNDSLVVSYETENSTKEVFKKKYLTKSKIHWNPSGKSYEFQGNSTLVHTKFLENGLYIDYLPEIEEVGVGHWNTFNIKDNLFLVLDKLSIIALSVDSLTNRQAHLSIQDEQNFSYTFKEQNLETPKNLLGDWKLITCDTLRKKHAPFTKGYQWPTLNFLRISKDSILSKKNNVETTEKWTLGGASNLIILPDAAWKIGSQPGDTLTTKEIAIRRKILKIDSLSENRLVLLAEYELFELNKFEIKLTYQRKN